MIPYGRQDITQADIDAVVAVLQSEYLTQGPVVPMFERAVIQHIGAMHALAVNSATSALHIACLALGLGPGDWLWTTAISFVASANCGLYCGACIDFIDINPHTYNICTKALKSKLIAAEKNGRLPKVLIAVHLCGQSCDMEEIHALSQKYNFRIIEDASHAIGAKYKGEFIGSCRFSDIVVFSFHPVKIITTGEGGMVLTNCNDLAREMALLRSHGITRELSQMTNLSDGPWYYQQIRLGFNYRMTDIEAALGLSQIRRLDLYVSRRHELANNYDRLLRDFPVTTPLQHPDSYSSFHLYVIRLQLDNIKKTHREVFEGLRNLGIGVNLHYIPIYAHPYYQSLGFKKDEFIEAERYYAEAISLPIFPTMSNADQQEVLFALREALES